jgi:hypothetical protein
LTPQQPLVKVKNPENLPSEAKANPLFSVLRHDQNAGDLLDFSASFR